MNDVELIPKIKLTSKNAVNYSKDFRQRQVTAILHIHVLVANKNRTHWNECFTVQSYILIAGEMRQKIFG